MKHNLFILLCLATFTGVSGCGKSESSSGVIQSPQGVAATPGYTAPGVEGYGEPLRGEPPYVFVNYRFKEGTCDTDRHSFSGPDASYVLQQLCQGLQNQWMNHGCALSARQAYFSQMCGGFSFNPR